MAADIGPATKCSPSPSRFLPPRAPFLSAGARPVFVDVEPDTFNMDVPQLESRARDASRHQSHSAGASLWRLRRYGPDPRRPPVASP